GMKPTSCSIVRFLHSLELVLGGISCGYLADPIAFQCLRFRLTTVTIIRASETASRASDQAAPDAAWLVSLAIGTPTRISVPSVGLDVISMIPFTRLTRSLMLIRPRPRLIIAAAASKPTPLSRTTSWISPETPRNCTSKRCAPLCLIELLKDSCNTLKRQREISCGTTGGTFSVVKLTCTLCHSAVSWQKLLHAATRPKYSSFDECKR